jgi:hypothetical protein
MLIDAPAGANGRCERALKPSWPELAMGFAPAPSEMQFKIGAARKAYSRGADTHLALPVRSFVHSRSRRWRKKADPKAATKRSQKLRKEREYQRCASVESRAEDAR